MAAIRVYISWKCWGNWAWPSPQSLASLHCSHFLPSFCPLWALCFLKCFHICHLFFLLHLFNSIQEERLTSHWGSLALVLIHFYNIFEKVIFTIRRSTPAFPRTSGWKIMRNTWIGLLLFITCSFKSTWLPSSWSEFSCWVYTADLVRVHLSLLWERLLLSGYFPMDNFILHTFNLYNIQAGSEEKGK